MSIFVNRVLFVGFVYNVLLYSVLITAWNLQGFFGMIGVMLPDVPVTIVWVIVLIVTRSMHGGRVISGDLCELGKEGCSSAQGYQKVTGWFLLIWIIYTCIIFTFNAGKRIL
jgi:hypothetical protein